MIIKDEISAMQAHIAKAHADGAVWRASGRQEKYVEAVCTANALEAQLELLRQSGLRQSMRSFARAPVQLTVEPPYAGARSALREPPRR